MEVRRNDEGRGEHRRWAFFSSLLKLRAAVAAKKDLEVLTEFLRRDDTHDFVMKFFEIVYVVDIPGGDDHSGTKPSVDP